MNNIIKVTNLIVKDDGEMLLIKEWSKKRQGYFWNIIKGTFDSKKDLDILGALKRETREEVNLPFDAVGLLSIFQEIKPEYFLFQINFLSKPKKSIYPKIPKTFDVDEEIISYKWFSKKEFDQINLNELMSDKVRLVVDLWYREKKVYPISNFLSVNN